MQIAIVGVTGNLGQDIVESLNRLEREDITLKGFELTSESSDDIINYAGESLFVEKVESDSFDDFDIVVLAVSSSDAEGLCKQAVESGASVIDASGAMVSAANPLVLYNHNIEKIEDGAKVVVSPNPLAQQLVSILSPLDKSVKVKKVVSSTYQSVSGKGKGAIAELYEQSASLLSGQEHSGIVNFSTQIGFNCIPATSDFINENTKDEIQLITQTQILLERPLPITATCVQIPTFIGYAQTLSLEFEDSIDPLKVKEILENSENVRVVDDVKKDAYATPYGCAETSGVYVSRIRKDYSNPNTINLWVVSDNLRMSALNIVNIIKKLSYN